MVSFNSNTEGSRESKEDQWDYRFGHSGMRSLQMLAKEKLMNGSDYGKEPMHSSMEELSLLLLSTT